MSEKVKIEKDKATLKAIILLAIHDELFDWKNKNNRETIPSKEFYNIAASATDKILNNL